MFGQITEFRFFKKSFFSAKNLIWPLKPLFFLGGGVLLLKLFDPSNGLGAGNYQNSHFWAKSALNISKTTALIKKF